jgi:acyl CoA:acetate/3-ketoacid CoA transferase beta subunit
MPDDEREYRLNNLLEVAVELRREETEVGDRLKTAREEIQALMTEMGVREYQADDYKAVLDARIYKNVSVDEVIKMVEPDLAAKLIHELSRVVLTVRRK